MEYTIKKNDELYHYGVKGMRWGVRKKINSYKIYKTIKKEAKKEDAEYQIYSRVSKTRAYRKSVDPHIEELAAKLSDSYRKLDELFEYKCDKVNEELGKILNGRDANRISADKMDKLSEIAHEKAERKWVKDDEYRKIKEAYEVSEEAYKKALDKEVTDIIGKYGDITIKELDDKTVIDIFDTAIKRDVSHFRIWGNRFR